MFTLMTGATESICELLGGTTEIREFEDKYNPMSFYAMLRCVLKIPDAEARKAAEVYEKHYDSVLNYVLKYKGVL